MYYGQYTHIRIAFHLYPHTQEHSSELWLQSSYSRSIRDLLIRGTIQIL